jgi:NAD(P)-dependent dehydrogenase (short-subunit alcohol dehydrogenase family)/acyl carrier protein
VFESRIDKAGPFYIPTWKRTPLIEYSVVSGPVLVFLDGTGTGAELVRLLRSEGLPVASVEAGTKFQRSGDASFAINPEAKEDYRSLLKELQTAGFFPRTIIHLWCVTDRERETPVVEACDDVRKMGFNSLLFLAQALGEQLRSESIQLKVVTNHLFKIAGDEVLSPAKAMVVGPCRVIPEEHPDIQCSMADLDDGLSGKQAQLLVKELAAKTAAPVVAYRGEDRWVEGFERASLAKADLGNSRLRDGGVYLITGGAGGIGLVLAEYLAESVNAKIALISRSGLLTEQEWQRWLATHNHLDEVSRKIRKVQSIRNLGSEVAILKADVSDAAQMKAAIDEVQARFGSINGVIHAAGTFNPGTVAEKDAKSAAAVLEPKVNGTLLLGELLRESNLDFFVLCSSLSVQLGGIRMVDYCSANAFLDAYAQKHHAENNVISINWCGWQEVGMAVKARVPAPQTGDKAQTLRHQISPENGKDAFGRILGASHPQVIVSLQDLTTTEAGDESAAPVTGEKTMTKPIEGEAARPEMASDYVVPGNSTEQIIADIWKELLGVSSVGVDDNFFDLGGESALATILISRMKEEFSIELSVVSLFENPTVRALSDMVQQAGEGDSSLDESRQRAQRRKERMRG